MDEKANCYKVLIEEESGRLISLYMTGENTVTYETGKDNVGIEGTPLFAFYKLEEAMSVARNFLPHRGNKVVVYEAIGVEKVKRPPFLLKLGYAKRSVELVVKYWINARELDKTYHTQFIPFTILYKSIFLLKKIYDGPVMR